MKHPHGRAHGPTLPFRLKLLCLACLLATSHYAAAQESTGTLKDIEVTASTESSADSLPESYAGGQVAKGARIGLLGNVDILDIPFSVTSYTAQTIADQQAKTVGDVLKNDPAVRMTTSDGHNAEAFTIRGFAVSAYDIAFDGLYGLLPSAHTPTDLIERVDVFEGPAAMLSGMAPTSSIGGVINIVPKRAGDTPLTRLTASYTTHSQWGLAADVGRRFGDDKRLGIRVNTAYSDGITAVQDQNKREQLGSVAIDYRGRGWNMSLDAYRTDQSQSNGSPMMVGFASLGYVLAAPDGSTNLFKGTYVNQVTSGVVLRGNFDLNDKWTLYGAIGQGLWDWSGISVQGTRVNVTNASGTSTSAVTYGQAGYTHNTTGEIGLRGSFSTGSISHKVVLNASAMEQITGAAASNSTTSAAATTNIYNPGTLTLAKAAGAVYKTADNIFTSAGVADTMSILDDRLAVTVGLRAQRIETKTWKATAPTVLSDRYDKSAITPTIGLVLKPWSKSTSLYANYIEGLSVGDTVATGYTNSGSTLTPYKTKQVETGVKWDAGQFTNTLALFQISKPGGMAVSNGNGTSTYTDGAEQRNRGIEWKTFGQLTEQLRLLGGVAYIQGKLVKSATAAYTGHTAAGVPKWTANLGSEWDLPWLSGVTLEGRVIYTSSQYIDSANKLQLPGWTRYDAGARYRTKIGGKPVVFRANIENLTNRAYWSGYFQDGYATIGAPRTIKLSASVDF